MYSWPQFVPVVHYHSIEQFGLAGLQVGMGAETCVFGWHTVVALKLAAEKVATRQRLKAKTRRASFMGLSPGCVARTRTEYGAAKGEIQTPKAAPVFTTLIPPDFY